MKGTLELRNIRCTCIIGVYEEERLQQQEVSLDVTVEVDFLSLRDKKNTEGTVDWAKLPESLCSLLKEHQFYLAEDACLALGKYIATHTVAQSVKVALTKLEAATGATSVAAILEATAEELRVVP
jgi:dihydroneopterin aldolase